MPGQSERKHIGDAVRRKDGRLELRFVVATEDLRGDGQLVVDDIELLDLELELERTPATGETVKLYELPTA